MKPPPTKGMRVAVDWDRSMRGTVVAAGPCQSEVRLDGRRGPDRDQVFMNKDLVRLVRRARRM